MNSQNLINLRNGNFEVEDFDSENMTAIIVFDDKTQTHSVRFFAEEIMDCAMSSPFNFIEGWDEPRFDDDEYRVNEYQSNLDRTVKVTFSMWWEGVSGLEKEELIKSALMLDVDRQLNRITNKITVSERSLAA